ncbi:mucin-2-like [Ambystoma mexicanum]|uniref:mucin-2-like n=1 Tax=Ambystoma mexicanum TaxID=8296 RepID=UPI0037E84B58
MTKRPMGGRAKKAEEGPDGLSPPAQESQSPGLAAQRNSEQGLVEVIVIIPLAWDVVTNARPVLSRVSVQVITALQANTCYNSLSVGKEMHHLLYWHRALDLPGGLADDNQDVCITWGNFQYRNFNGEIFKFMGTCTYAFAYDCSSNDMDFNIELKRFPDSTIRSIFIKISEVLIRIHNFIPYVNDVPVEMPFSELGIQIKKDGKSIIVTAQVGFVLTFRRNDRLELKLDEKYVNRTCGLCGHFTGIPSSGDYKKDLVFSDLKILAPNEICPDPVPVYESCSETGRTCEDILTGPAFEKCNEMLRVNAYIAACIEDLCTCKEQPVTSCLCGTVSEYSQACASAGGTPGNWRKPDLCREYR